MRDAARSGLAVGFFDGVHLGHQAILRRASAALTFRSHPLSVIAPEKAPRLLMTFEDRLAAIRACGVEDVTVLDFTPSLAAMGPGEFVARHMTQALRDGIVHCGDNWRFGKDGTGDAKFLERCGIKVDVVPYAQYEGRRISSTRIRAALEAGEITAANAMLGAPWTAKGELFAGKGEGARIGCPTVNLKMKDVSLRLRCGVYAVEVMRKPGVANYGTAPTFGERAWNSPVLEIHFIDGLPTVRPGKPWKVSFLGFAREERRFACVEDLRKQISADIADLWYNHNR